MTIEEIQQYVYDFLIAKGLGSNAVYGIMGNISQECSWDYQLEEVGGGGGYGLIQWTGERRIQLENWGIDLQSQCEFLYAELTGGNTSMGALNQWYDAKGYKYNTFISGEYSPSESAAAFCWCYERPNESLANLSYRQSEAERFSTIYTGGGASNKVDEAIKWMIEIANDDTHGYDQTYRWGEYGDYDCSSFVITAFENVGIPLKTNGATYTGDLKEVALRTDFTEISISDWNDTSQFKIGDIILNEHYHVACYIGNGQIVHASINELGTATGGTPGDQTGKEICIRDYYIYSHGWDCVLRYKVSGSGGDIPSEDGEVWKDITKTIYNTKQLSEEQIKELKKLKYSDTCKMKFTFTRNKSFIGRSFTNTKLIFDNKEYNILSVDNKGYLLIYINDKRYYKLINPKYIIPIIKESEESESVRV